MNLEEFKYSPVKVEVESPVRVTRQRIKLESPVTDVFSPTGSPAKRVKLESPESSPKKKRKSARPYADPSIYAHLPQSIQDHYRRDLILLICGLNPGVMTARTGYHFANPTNLFWPLLHSSGITQRRMMPSESDQLMDECSIGITNLVSRPTAEGGELSRAECIEGAKRVLALVHEIAPKAVHFSGKGIWDSVFNAIHGRGITKKDGFVFGWQKEVVRCKDDSECRIFVTMGTSGRVAAYSPAYKKEVFAELGAWVRQQRGDQSALIAP